MNTYTGACQTNRKPSKGGEDGSVDKVLATQAWVPFFESSVPTESQIW